MDIEELYQELIIDHGTEPRNFRSLPNASHHAKGVNPLCGDRLEVFLNVDHEKIHEISFTGSGCAISMASASIMTEILKNKRCDEAESLFKLFIHMLRSEEKPDPELGKLAALVGVRVFPSRVKCATLAWHALDAALTHKTDPTSTE